MKVWQQKQEEDIRHLPVKYGVTLSSGLVSTNIRGNDLTGCSKHFSDWTKTSENRTEICLRGGMCLRQESNGSEQRLNFWFKENGTSTQKVKPTTVWWLTWMTSSPAWIFLQRSAGDYRDGEERNGKKADARELIRVYRSLRTVCLTKCTSIPDNITEEMLTQPSLWNDMLLIEL